MEILTMDKVNEIIPKMTKLLGENGTVIAKCNNRIEVSLIFGKVDFEPFDFFDDIMKKLGAEDSSNHIPHSYTLDGIRIVAFLGSVKQS